MQFKSLRWRLAAHAWAGRVSAAVLVLGCLGPFAHLEVPGLLAGGPAQVIRELGELAELSQLAEVERAQLRVRTGCGSRQSVLCSV